jgi:hypothetical protein
MGLRSRDMALGSRSRSVQGIFVYYVGIIAATLGLVFGSTTWLKWGLVAAGCVLVLVGALIYYVASRGAIRAASVLTAGLLLVGFGVLVVDSSAAWKEGGVVWALLIVGIVMIVCGILLMALQARLGRRKTRTARAQ